MGFRKLTLTVMLSVFLVGLSCTFAAKVSAEELTLEYWAGEIVDGEFMISYEIQVPYTSIEEVPYAVKVEYTEIVTLPSGEEKAVTKVRTETHTRSVTRTSLRKESRMRTAPLDSLYEMKFEDLSGTVLDPMHLTKAFSKRTHVLKIAKGTVITPAMRELLNPDLIVQIVDSEKPRVVDVPDKP